MRRALYFAFIFVCLGVVIIACQGIGAPASKPTVIVASPPSGSVYTVGEEVVVQSTSTDPAGITKVALLVDGNQVREDPSPVTQGQAQFSLIQSWVAESVGQHTLTVRATNAQGATSDSGIMINVREQNSAQPTSISIIATAVPIATSAPQPTSAPATSVPTNAAVTVVVTATPVPATDVPVPSATTPCADNAKFVADLTIPDGTIFTPNAVFNKSWRVLNNGSCPWNNYSLVFASGVQMAASGIFPVPSTAPGATADLTVPMTAPPNYGKYTGIWRLRNANGQIFGTNLTVVINVPSPATAVPPTNTPVPTIAGCSGQPNDFQFNASATTINGGQSVTLSWSAVSNASEVRLDGGEFSNEGVETPGNRTVAPSTTTSYTLTAKCNNSGSTRQKTITITVNGSSFANFAGNWSHNFGTMVLAQSGANVNGSYNPGYGGSGTIDGVVTGNTLNGNWHSGGDSGTLKLVLSGNGNTFNGNWNGTYQWCGARSGQAFPNGCAFDGKWKTQYNNPPTQCDMELNQVGNQVSGTYCNGTVSGTVSYVGLEIVFNGTWKIPAPAQGPFSFHMPLFSSSYFQGNYNGSFQWCGWRSGGSAPSPCLK